MRICGEHINGQSNTSNNTFYLCVIKTTFWTLYLYWCPKHNHISDQCLGYLWYVYVRMFFSWRECFENASLKCWHFRSLVYKIIIPDIYDIFIPVVYLLYLWWLTFEKKLKKKYLVKHHKNMTARKRPHISIRRVIGDSKKSIIIDNGDQFECQCTPGPVQTTDTIYEFRINGGIASATLIPWSFLQGELNVLQPFTGGDYFEATDSLTDFTWEDFIWIIYKKSGFFKIL